MLLNYAVRIWKLSQVLMPLYFLWGLWDPTSALAHDISAEDSEDNHKHMSFALNYSYIILLNNAER